MTKSSLVAGLAGSLILVAVGSVYAQDAQPADQPPSGQAAPAAPAVPVCEGLKCLFSPSAAPAPQPVAQATEQGQPVAAPANVETSTTQEEPVTRKVKLKPREKPLHPVTIAVDEAETARLKELAAALPRGKVRISLTRHDKSAETDFSVETALDANSQSEKAKLFTEQMHVVAGSEIHSISDLKDKVVSFGPEGSAGQAVARKAFEALKISVKEAPLDLGNALDGLATGDIAAVVVLAPQPAKSIETLSGQGLHLVSWPEGGGLPSGAVAAKIDSTRYPGLAKSEDTLRAVGVEAVLVMSAKGTRQPASKSFLAALAQHSAALSKRGFDLLKADLETRNGRHFASDAH